MTTCPDDETLLAFGRGALDDATRTEVVAHLDACEICHEVVVGAARADEPAAGSSGAVTIGRYLIERPIGAGSMGLVFAAHDPDLERRVALKLLRRQLAEDEDRRLEQRLLGEARAIAKLAHPNVVAAYEVARHDGELYLVMELIEGPTLTGWLAGHRTWQERLAMLTQAGRGLAAAHAAGIVHRDFKLDNVLVGPDGRARVTDFGLASGSLSGPTPELLGNALALTMTGALAGTPLFMAPEVLRGEPATTTSDQFSFAVSVWTALHNVRPFRGDSIRALIADIERGEPRGRTRIPAALREYVQRGLASDPAARWPSLDAMLDALARIAAPRRRWPLALAGTAALGLVAAGVAFATRAPARCTLATADTLWDASAAKVRMRLDTVVPARAAEIEAAVGTAVTDWRTRWRAERDAACGLPDATRATCLELQLHQVESVVAQLADADAKLAENAIDITRTLPDPRSCLHAISRAPDELDETAIALGRRLAEARALILTGQWEQARIVNGALEAELRVANRPGLHVRALLQLADALLDVDHAATARHLHAAIAIASQRGDDHAIAEGLIVLANTHGTRGDLATQEALAPLADAALARAGGDPELAARLAHGKCRVGWRRDRSEYARAVADCEASARSWRALRGDDAPELAGVENQLGMIAYSAERYGEAVQRFRAFEARTRRTHGPDYIDIDVSRVNTASVLLKLGKLDEAEPMYRDLIARRGWGSALGGLADLLRARGQLDEALVQYRACAAWNEANHYDADRCDNLVTISELLAELKRPLELDAATAACTQHASPSTDARLAALRSKL